MKVQMKMTYQCIIRLLGVQIEIVVTATMFGVKYDSFDDSQSATGLGRCTMYVI